ncbi:MAG: DUF6265 family protein [Thermoanaerobaculales bacterium]|jgi:hypothetical protein|nr:DUF6265 family protein [Thermoanaerobaculales bacterium]
MRLRVLLVLSLAATISGWAGSTEPPTAAIADLGWIAGHWRLERGATIVEEGWLGPAGGTMLGVNRTVSGDRTTGFELLRIEERDGALVLLASPDGRCPATEFTLAELADRRAVFANPEHDFPQTIVYRREGSTLHAEIAGTDGGEPRSASWSFELMP